MARLIPLILIALAVWFWLRARRKTAFYLSSYETPEAGGRKDDEGRGPRAPAA
ncbi:hypothetical protein ACFQ6U_35725 [Streptomyces sp. NPDC056465]|uniref:hypothetical protein n=1 Tax=Streptomyces sp. NPDC056465 TaxID=3345829 RepID=UPI00369FDF45